MPKRKDVFALMPSGGFRKIDTDNVYIQTLSGGYKKVKGKFATKI